MGSIRMIYDELNNEFLKLYDRVHLNLQGQRKIAASDLRYCLEGDRFWIPKSEDLKIKRRVSWSWVSSDTEYSSEFYKKIPLSYTELIEIGYDFGSYFKKRFIEEKNQRIFTKKYISNNIIESISKNPEVLNDISKRDFEKLTAEIFVRMGFDVDLYRGTKDNGIDFLAVNFEEEDSFIICVQCKHPDTIKDKKRKSIGVATVREIYGVSKANNYDKSIVITSSKFSKEAETFRDLKPLEIELINRNKLLDWILKYRWNTDE